MPSTFADFSAWFAAETSPMFAVHANGRVLTAQASGMRIDAQTASEGGGRRVSSHRFVADNGLDITNHVASYANTSLIEQWQTVTNRGEATVQITRLDSVALSLAPDSYELFAFTSNWGSEFEPVRVPVASMPVIESRSGRSSKGNVPWFALFRPDGTILSAAVAWSGNWVFRFETGENGEIALSGGLHDWEFTRELAPGMSIESPPVALVPGEAHDLNTVSVRYARVGRRHWYPQNARARQLPVEWNHWWPYEDSAINEQVFRANVEAAAKLGIEVCTLDAGWFGPTDPGTHWYDFRGDWAEVNAVRFPSGIRALSDYVHQHGMAFGLWCEIEALGQSARLAERHPEFAATRTGERLGYVCFGNPAVQEWAFELLSGLIEQYNLDWIKFDFNLDPAAGCARTDHGHGAGDGLFAHYSGYYRTLERLRERFPEITLENCSSGGLRIDLGIMRRTTPTFLSDPDWPEHGLQLIWGASMVLAPSAWLHWGYSEWINGYRPQQFNPRDPALQPRQLDYYARIGMLGNFGLSQKLPELPAWVADRYAAHIALYRETVRRFVRDADFYRLTAQPRREGGSRWAAFQYVREAGAEHLLAVFRLPSGEPARTLRLYTIDPERTYTLTWLQTDRHEQRRGAHLLEHGLTFDDVPEQGSVLVHIR